MGFDGITLCLPCWYHSDTFLLINAMTKPLTILEQMERNWAAEEAIRLEHRRWEARAWLEMDARRPAGFMAGEVSLGWRLRDEQYGASDDSGVL